MKFLLYGYKGWIGQMISTLLGEGGHIVIEGLSRCENIIHVYDEIRIVNPDRVICTIGRTSGEGIPNIDFLEEDDKLFYNMRDNLLSPLIIADCCYELGVHMVYMGTGCIYTGYDKAYAEDDIPNFTGSKYSWMKSITDSLIRCYSNVLNVRIRMPITLEESDKDLITKVIGFKKVITDQNSMSYLPCLLPILIDMSLNAITGTINLINPGSIAPADIVEIYSKYKSHKYKAVSADSLMREGLVKAPRSNNILSTDKLLSMYPDIPSIKDIINDVMRSRYA